MCFTLIDADCRAYINRNIAEYRSFSSKFIGQPACECEFLIMLNIKCARTPASKKKSYKDQANSFFDWLKMFLATNNINFPCADNLFFTLMICALSATGFDPKSKNSDEIIKTLLSELMQRSMESQESLITCVRKKNRQVCDRLQKDGCFVECDCCPCVCCEEH